MSSGVQVFSEWICNRVIFQKLVVGIFYGYSLFLAISFRMIFAGSSEFSIIGLLYYAQYYQGFLYLQYSGLFSESYQVCSTAGIRMLSVSNIRHCSKIYTAGSAEDVYILIIVQST